MPLFRKKNKSDHKKNKIENKDEKSNSSKFQSNDAAKDNNNLNSGNAEESSGYTNEKTKEMKSNQSSDNNEKKLSSSFEENIKTINEIFDGDDTIVKRRFQNEHGLKFYLFYSDGLVSSVILNEHIMQPLLECEVKKSRDSIEELINHVINVSETKVVSKHKDIVQAVSYGDTALLIEGQDNAIIMSSKAFFMRAVAEPDNEKTVSGPREGFTEVLLANLSLVKRRLRTDNLKMKYYSFGLRTHTQACICYIDGIVNKEVLKELYKRLDKIDIDSVLDVNYLAEHIRDSKYTLFRQSGITEKPDAVVGKLLEGRIAIFVDGSPVVMTVPYLFIENFQMGDDYYTNYLYGTISRLIRVSSYFLTILVPSLYVAIVAFHKEMLPTVFLTTVATERSGVPFPIIIEMVIMFIVFDILREAGVRMPSGVGTALSIVGALVIGQAAVEAKLLDAPVIIIVAFSSITGLLNPRMGAAVVVIRLVFLILASIFGLYGFILSFSLLIIHLYNLTSLGVPQLKNYEEIEYENIKDIFIRGPWPKMKTRPSIAQDSIRMKTKNEKN